MKINIDPSWQHIITHSINELDPKYLYFLKTDKSYFPDIDNFLNAFKTLPLNKTKYILFGQDPYPREKSAIGYAFIDGMVDHIFSNSGLSKDVNRATSLRNFVKMLLLAEDKISDKATQEDISQIKKDDLINSIIQLKNNFEKNGVLLLNMSLIFTKKEDSAYHIKRWKAFISSLLEQLKDQKIELILFGNMAKLVEKIDISRYYKVHKFMHPYNVKFITDKKAHKLFKKMNLLNTERS